MCRQDPYIHYILNIIQSYCYQRSYSLIQAEWLSMTPILFNYINQYLWLPQFSFLTSENTSIIWGRSCSENLWKLHDRLTTVCWVEESSVPTRPVSVDQWCTMLLSSCTLQPPRSQHPSPCLTPPPHHSSLHKPTSHQQFQ